MKSTDIGIELINDLDHFDREVKAVYRNMVIPTWEGELHGLPDALYGYMMGVFARIDLVSAYWAGTFGKRGFKPDQTERMVGFMDEFFHTDHKANSVLVQCWRHKLMHTAKPRRLFDSESGISYRWLLHWWEHLPREQHFTFDETNSGILRIGLVYLIQDYTSAIKEYLVQLTQNSDAAERLRTVERELATEKLREVKQWRVTDRG